jgi:hypothetical protein
MKDQNYIEKIKVYKVANGFVIQITLVGITTELTFVCPKDADLGQSIDNAIQKALEEKL